MGMMNVPSTLDNQGFDLRVSRGVIPGTMAVNKFGNAPDGLQTTTSDFWPLANATPTQQVWLAPTAARVHAIVSTSTSDDGDPVGVGARTVRVFGLKTWDSLESTEDVTLNGTSAVNTVNSYVNINRMIVLTSGATSINVGTITATAATDSTITALILAGEGQTQQAIYALGSTTNLYIRAFSITIGSQVAAHRASCTLKVCSQPTTQPAIFTHKHKLNVVAQGTSARLHPFCPPLKIEGPAIVKISGIASAADVDGAAHFDGHLITE